MGSSAIWRDTLTVWPQEGGRRVLRGVRVEDSQALSYGPVQPTGASSMRAYLMAFQKPVAPSPGDYVAAGDIDCATPPDGCRRVESVAEFTLHGRPHHLEVSAS